MSGDRLSTANRLQWDGGWDRLLNRVAQDQERETRNQKLEMRSGNRCGGKSATNRDSSRSFGMTRDGSARAAERPLRRVNQGAQGRIDGWLVGEILSDVR